MAQDFAKQHPPQQQASRKPARGLRPPARVSRLNWFISGFLFGVLCLAGGYIALLQYQNKHAETLEASASKTAPAKLPAFQFGFYHDLSKAEVPVKTPDSSPTTTATNPTTVKAAATTHTASTETPAGAEPAAVNFLLQAGSFQDKLEADERRAKITLLNMSAEIVPGVVAGRTWYRVQVGPFNGRNAAEDARKHLSASNIDSIPLLMR